jgi:hypothetical protein
MTNARIKNLALKVSQEEYQLIQEKAKENDMSLSSYLRARILIDKPSTNYSSFEFIAIKSISYCAAILNQFASKELSEKELEELNTKIKEIMISNGIDPDKIKNKPR